MMRRYLFRFEKRYPFFNQRSLGLDDVRHLCDQEGITLVFKNLHCFGLYVRIKEIPTVFVHEALSEAQKVFTVLHELGHHFLHPNLSRAHLTDIFFPYVEIERQATDVALHGIAPTPLLEKMLHFRGLNTSELARRFPAFEELKELSSNPTLQAINFTRRRVELFFQERRHPGLDYVERLRHQARALAGRRARPISDNEVCPGMTEVEALVKWGDPTYVLRRRHGRSDAQKWTFQRETDDGAPVRQRLFFREGTLVAAEV